MTVASAAIPSVEVGRALWERLLAADPTASADLAEAYLDPLIAWLGWRYPRVDAAIREAAADEAILSLIRKPRAYQPERQTLGVYLRIAAVGDLKNLLRSEARHHQGRVDLAAVEVSPTLGKYLWDESADPAVVVERAEEEAMRSARARLARDEVVPGLSPEEVGVFDLMGTGERRTIAYARALGIEDWPIERQRREVKRVKDRIKKRVQRRGQGDG